MIFSGIFCIPTFAKDCVVEIFCHFGACGSMADSRIFCLSHSAYIMQQTCTHKYIKIDIFFMSCDLQCGIKHAVNMFCAMR